MPQVKRYGESGSYTSGISLGSCTALSIFSPPWMQWGWRHSAPSGCNCFQMGLQSLILFLKKLKSLLRAEGWYCYEQNQGFCPRSAESPNNCPFVYKESSGLKWCGYYRSEVDLEVYFQTVLARSGFQWSLHLWQNCSAGCFGTSPWHGIMLPELTGRGEGISGTN